LPHFIMDRRIKSGDDPMRFIAISSHSLPIFDCQTAIRTCALVSAPALFSRVRTFVSPSNFFCANGISARRVRRGPERRFGRNGVFGPPLREADALTALRRKRPAQRARNRPARRFCAPGPFFRGREPFDPPPSGG
jgi:hypothetical protein